MTQGTIPLWHSHCFGPSHARSKDRKSRTWRGLTRGLLRHSLLHRFRGGCGNNGLRRGRRKPGTSPAAPTSPINHRERLTFSSFRLARRHAAGHSHRQQHEQHSSQLEREQHSRREQRRRHDIHKRPIHGTAESARAGPNQRPGLKSGRPFEDWHCHGQRHERPQRHPGAGDSQRGTGRSASVPGRSLELRQSKSSGRLEPRRGGMQRLGLRDHRCKRDLYGAENPARPLERDADGP